MKVLILSCNTGGGHNSCARAIGTELQRRGHTFSEALQQGLSVRGGAPGVV